MATRCNWCGEKHKSLPAFGKCTVCKTKLDQPYSHVYFINALRQVIGLQVMLNASTRTTKNGQQ
jgi:DNA polymerase II large subunit